MPFDEQDSLLEMLDDIEQFLASLGDADFLIDMLYMGGHGAFRQEEFVAYERHRPTDPL